MSRLTLLLLLFVPGCIDGGRRHLGQDVSSLTAAEEVASIIANLPSWPETIGGTSFTTTFTGADMDAFELAALRVQKFSLSQILDGIELAMADAAEVGTLDREIVRANTFVLLRIAFAVPATLTPSSVEVHSPYTAWPYFTSGSSYYPILWPVTFDTGGRVHSIARFEPPLGTTHQIIDEYDWLSSTYGFRTLPSCEDRCGNYSPSTACQCDMWCEAYGDCCVDYDLECGSSSLIAGPDEDAAATEGGRGAPGFE